MVERHLTLKFMSDVQKYGKIRNFQKNGTRQSLYHYRRKVTNSTATTTEEYHF